MLNTTIGAVRKYGNKVGAAAGALALSTAAMAQSVPMSEQIVAKVTDSFTTGELVAGTVVLGLFSLWAIKLLLKSK
ncbi:hypothetical protein [Comamonas jiangduensis]|uniref:Uncharacterized protein n=1 Tax=Comamonas jiangduensis TaxID=1194168 RepID=A0ABV4IAJ6_9BURK